MPHSRLHIPETVEEALELLREYGDDAKVLAGGTALMIMMRSGLVQPPHVISLSRLGDLRRIDDAENRVRMGALVTLRDAERSPTVQRRARVLAETIRLVANVRVRNVATVGGNVAEADYASDPPCVLRCLDARVRIRRADSESSQPLSSFFRDYYETSLEPEELVTAVEVPDASDFVGTYLKYITRSSEDRPCVGVAALARCDEAGTCRELRVAVGAATAVPFRVRYAEGLARDQPLDEELIDEIAELYAAEANPLSDLRGSAEYRRSMIAVLVRRAVRAVGDGRGGAAKL